MEKVEFNKSEGKIRLVMCPKCTNTTRHKVLASVDTEGSGEMSPGDWISWSSSHQVIQCQGCTTLSFRVESSDSESYYEDEGPLFDEFLYPIRTTDSWSIKSFPNLPHSLRKIYRETVDCYNNDSLTLCGAGVRALVEGLCKANGIVQHKIDVRKEDGKVKKQLVFDNLEKKIEGLHEKGILTKKAPKFCTNIGF